MSSIAAFNAVVASEVRARKQAKPKPTVRVTLDRPSEYNLIRLTIHPGKIRRELVIALDRHDTISVCVFPANSKSKRNEMLAWGMSNHSKARIVKTFRSWGNRTVLWVGSACFDITDDEAVEIAKAFGSIRVEEDRL